MLVGEVPLARCVFLDERQVARDMESRLAPRSQKLVRAIPGIEAHAEAIPAKHAMDFCEGGLDPCVVVVVRDRAAVFGS